MTPPHRLDRERPGSRIGAASTRRATLIRNRRDVSRFDEEVHRLIGTIGDSRQVDHSAGIRDVVGGIGGIRSEAATLTAARVVAERDLLAVNRNGCATSRPRAATRKRAMVSPRPVASTATTNAPEVSDRVDELGQRLSCGSPIRSQCSDLQSRLRDRGTDGRMNDGRGETGIAPGVGKVQVRLPPASQAATYSPEIGPVVGDRPGAGRSRTGKEASAAADRSQTSLSETG
jgi:hypothetical protein